MSASWCEPAESDWTVRLDYPKWRGSPFGLRLSRWRAELVEPAWRPGRQPKVNRASQESNTSNAGPWKKGNTLTRADAPRIANLPLLISAEIEPAAPNGVIVVQDAAAHGYTLYVQERKLCFAVRIARELTVVTASEPVPGGPSKVQAQLAADGQITLSVNDKPVAKGKASGPIDAQPGRGLSIGADNGTVGDYSGPNAFDGKVENVTVRAL